MRVTVLYFGIASDFADCKEDHFDLPEDSTVADLLQRIDEHHPRFADIARQIRPVINGQPATTESPLADGDEIAFLRASAEKPS